MVLLHASVEYEQHEANDGEASVTFGSRTRQRHDSDEPRLPTLRGEGKRRTPRPQKPHPHLATESVPRHPKAQVGLGELERSRERQRSASRQATSAPTPGPGGIDARKRQNLRVRATARCSASDESNSLTDSWGRILLNGAHREAHEPHQRPRRAEVLALGAGGLRGHRATLLLALGGHAGVPSPTDIGWTA